MIPINKPWLGEDEKQEILNILEENVLTSPLLMEEKDIRI